MNKKQNHNLTQTERLPIRTDIRAGYTFENLYEDAKDTGNTISNATMDATKSVGSMVKKLTQY